MDSLLQLALSATKIAELEEPFPNLLPASREHYSTAHQIRCFFAKEVGFGAKTSAKFSSDVGSTALCFGTGFFGGTAASASVNPFPCQRERDGWEPTLPFAGNPNSSSGFAFTPRKAAKQPAYFSFRNGLDKIPFFVFFWVGNFPTEKWKHDLL